MKKTTVTWLCDLCDAEQVGSYDGEIPPVGWHSTARLGGEFLNVTICPACWAATGREAEAAAERAWVDGREEAARVARKAYEEAHPQPTRSRHPELRMLFERRPAGSRLFSDWAGSLREFDGERQIQPRPGVSRDLAGSSLLRDLPYFFLVEGEPERVPHHRLQVFTACACRRCTFVQHGYRGLERLEQQAALAEAPGPDGGSR